MSVPYDASSSVIELAADDPTLPFAPGTRGRTSQPLATRRPPSTTGWLSAAAMAAVSNAWDYVVDEAAVAEAAPQLAAVKPSIDVVLNVSLAGGLWHASKSHAQLSYHACHAHPGDDT